MKFIRTIETTCFSILLLASCSQTTVLQVDFTQQQGLYIVGYSDNFEIRSRMEDQLVADLIQQDIIAMASYMDVANITERTPQELIDAAIEKNVLGIILINQVAADSSGSIVQNPDRVSPNHSTVQEFYAYSRTRATESIAEDDVAFAEVNLFMLDDGEAKLYWSGTTWSFNVDNQGGAIRDISNTIVQQLTELRDQIL